MSAKSVAERHRRVVELKLTRPVWTWEQIAADAGLSRRQALAVWKQEREEGIVRLTREEALDLFHDHLRGLQTIRTKLAELLDSAYQDSVKIGALREMAALLKQEIALRQSYGQVPKNLGYLAVEADVRWLTNKIMEILRTHDLLDAPPGDDLLKALESQLPAGYQFPDEGEFDLDGEAEEIEQAEIEA